MHANKKLIAAALTAALTAGGLVGAMFGAPTISSAQTLTAQEVERADHPARAGEERSVEDRGHRQRGNHPRRLALEAAAEALGISAEELKTELRKGKSVRTVAQEKGVAVETVIEAIVAAVTEHAEERATAFVDRERPSEEEPQA